MIPPVTYISAIEQCFHALHEVQMNSSLLQLLVLAGIAVFMILRLRNVLGPREGYEEPRQEGVSQARRGGPELEVIEGGPLS